MKNVLFRLIRRIASRFGIRVQHAHEAEELSVPAFIKDTFKDARSVRILQIGANDGKSDWDPIAPFHDKPGYTGILLEPQPKAFHRLKKHLSGRSQWTTINAAVAEKSGSIDFHVVGSPMKSKHPLSCDQIASTIRSEVVNKLVSWGHSPAEAEELTLKITVDSLSFGDLAASSGGHFDLVAIDAEGMDFQLVKLMLEAGILPRLLIFEHSHLRTDERLEIPRLLSQRGYAYFPCGGDTVARLLDFGQH